MLHNLACTCDRNSVTMWLGYFFNIWPFTNLNLPNCQNFCQSRFNILPNTTKALKMATDVWNIFPILVTLDRNDNIYGKFAIL